jgi:hypothetical protein
VKKPLSKFLFRQTETRILSPEHCVLAKFKLRSPGFGDREERDAIHELTGKLAAAINDAAAGEFDGDEFGGGECTLFMYGPDADRLFAAVYPPLSSWSPLKGGIVVKRYGPPGSSEQHIAL